MIAKTVILCTIVQMCVSKIAIYSIEEALPQTLDMKYPSGTELDLAQLHTHPIESMMH